MSRRRCLQCERPLTPSEQGALCSPCYFKTICDPASIEPAQSAEIVAGKWPAPPSLPPSKTG